MKTWNIYKADGHYVGQSQALNAETAFCQYMSTFSGPSSVSPQDIKAKEIEPSVCEITYHDEVFIVRTTTQA